MRRIDKLKNIETLNKRLLGESEVVKEIITEDIHSNKSPVPGDSKPKFGRMELNFDSEVDKALYIVFNDLSKSKRDPEFLQWLESKGYTKDEIMREGKKIKKYIKKELTENSEFPGWVDGTWTQMVGEIHVPSMGSEPQGVQK